MLQVIRVVNVAYNSTEKGFYIQSIYTIHNRKYTGNSYLESLILLVTQLRYKIFHYKYLVSFQDRNHFDAH